MPRIYHVKKARKAQGTCGCCGCKINPGDPYRYWEFRYGGRHVRCMKPQCNPKPSDLTQSEYLGRIGNLQARPIEGDTIEDLEALRDEIRDELQELASDCSDKLNNMPEGLQQGSTGEMLQERSSQCEDAASELDSIDFSWDEPEREEDETDEEFEERKEEELENRLTELKEEIANALGCL